MRTPTSLLALFITAAGVAAAQTVPNPQYVITVKRGDVPLGQITIELYPDVAPKHVRNFDSLVNVGFYDGTAFHRVVPDFVIQGGGFYSRPDQGMPKQYWGVSDDSQTRVPAEFSNLKHLRGIISMARLGDDINSGTSQFFICVADLPQLDGKYSIFGHVLEGMDVADTIVMSPRDANNSPNEKVEMTIAPKTSSSVGSEESLASAASLTALGNSSDGSIDLEYTTSISGDVSISLFDATGNAVRTMVNEVKEPGRYHVTVDQRGLPSGVYIAQMRAAGLVLTSRFVIVK